MQSYTEISENTAIKNSRELLLNNDKTALSNSSGTSFPTQNVQIGQMCFRTDVPGLYQYVAPNTWKKLFGIVNGNVVFENVPTYVAATGSALGLVKIGSNITNNSGTISLTKDNVTAALGYTPPTQDTNTTYSAATQSAAGLMSAADKKKLDGIASNANNYSLPTASESTKGGIKIGSGLSMSGDILNVTGAGVANDYITEYKVNSDGSWYRKYKSGWVEQGGLIEAGSLYYTKTITLIKAMANTKYNICITSSHNAYEGFNQYIYNITTTTFNAINIWSNNGDGRWVVAGQGA